MKRRRFLAVALFTALVSGAWWASRRIDDALQPGLASEGQRMVTVDDAVAKGRARRAFKIELVKLLVENRITLREATQRLLAYHDQEWANVPPGTDEVWYGRGLLPGDDGSEAARCARSLVSHVAQHLRTSAAAPEVLARLEREAGELLSQGTGD